MKANNLHKLYDKLGPSERVSALLAAVARDDEEEARKLIESAPVVTVEVAHHHLLLTAIGYCASHFMASVLSAGMALQTAMIERDTSEEFSDRGQQVLMESASEIKVVMAAWRKTCDEFGIPVESANYFLDMRILDRLEEMAEANWDYDPEPERIEETATAFIETIKKLSE